MLHENIKRIRKMRGLGLNELGREAGVTGSYISAIESGKRKNLSQEVLERIATALGVSIETLYGKSVYGLVHDRLNQLEMTFDDLQKKIGASELYFQQLDNRVPAPWDYDNLKPVAEVLEMRVETLKAALALNEPPTTHYDVNHTASSAFSTQHVNEIATAYLNDARIHEALDVTKGMTEEQFQMWLKMGNTIKGG